MFTKVNTEFIPEPYESILAFFYVMYSERGYIANGLKTLLRKNFENLVVPLVHCWRDVFNPQNKYTFTSYK